MDIYLINNLYRFGMFYFLTSLIDISIQNTNDMTLMFSSISLVKLCNNNGVIYNYFAVLLLNISPLQPACNLKDNSTLMSAYSI